MRTARTSYIRVVSIKLLHPSLTSNLTSLHMQMEGFNMMLQTRDQGLPTHNTRKQVLLSTATI